MQVEPIKKETLTEQIIKQLAEKITSGELKPGERLPDERTLATMFGVTRSRIREALRALSLIGLIDIRPGGGSFVSDSDTQVPHETILWTFHREITNLKDLYAARQLIEGAVYLSCFDNKTDEVVQTTQTYANRLLDLDITSETNEGFASLIDEIDSYIGETCGNGIYAKLMQTMVILRHDSTLRILSIPASRESAILWRVKVLKAFAQDSREQMEAALNGFFTNSVRELTDF